MPIFEAWGLIVARRAFNLGIGQWTLVMHRLPIRLLYFFIWQSVAIFCLRITDWGEWWLVHGQLVNFLRVYSPHAQLLDFFTKVGHPLSNNIMWRENLALLVVDYPPEIFWARGVTAKFETYFDALGQYHGLVSLKLHRSPCSGSTMINCLLRGEMFFLSEPLGFWPDYFHLLLF